MLNFLVVQIAAINLFQFDLDKPWNYPQYCDEKCTSIPFWKSRGEMSLSLSRSPASLLLFIQYNIWLIAISSNCLAALPAKMPVFDSHRRQNTYCRNLKWTFEDLLPCYCYAIKVNNRKFLPQFRNLPLQSKERTWVNCKQLITAWYQNSEFGSCAVWVPYQKMNCRCKN